MKTYRYGYTNAGNVALRAPGENKLCWVRTTGELVGCATFPDHILTATIEAETPEEAGRLAYEQRDIEFAVRQALREPPDRCDDETAWQLQRSTDQQRNQQLADAMFNRFTAQAQALTIGRLKARFTANQFTAILRSARHGYSIGGIGGDRIHLTALVAKLRAGIAASRSRRAGRATPCAPDHLPTRDCLRLTESQRRSPLARFYARLHEQREAAQRKREAIAARRAAPKRALALHIARQFHRHKPGFGQRGDGIAYGTGHGNTGTKRNGGPGTRCQAGVTWNKKGITLYPTHGGQPITIPKPPRNLVKLAQPDKAHPHGLFCTASTEFPGVDENIDYKMGVKRWLVIALSIRGVAIPERVARRDYTITDALAEPNAEIRRIMLERLPSDAILTALEEVHRDDFGILYKEADARRWARPHHLAYVKVVNSTPEPDGSFKDYILRVPPEISTARAAVAWTFGLKEDQYQPIAQS